MARKAGQRYASIVTALPAEACPLSQRGQQLQASGFRPGNLEEKRLHLAVSWQRWLSVCHEKNPLE
ncbi:hypothetical protein A4R35_13945 [Thermogemmatispora tikiterensis]|uniref:Uncharacterized protein n=1 Tax=Thermogemmatispora tikiterensis TaxID=1825093 RepID=A0A328VIC2_9CHLR|nr:hypothetical protein A4R35_13945 [Thermogemmatispora tikiterensis]